jgi:hypothetical protein
MWSLKYIPKRIFQSTLCALTTLKRISRRTREKKKIGRKKRVKITINEREREKNCPVKCINVKQEKI